jgi:hypothetical protein
MKAAKGCDCIGKVNKALEPHATKLVECFSLLGSTGCAVVASEKIPTVRHRVKPKTVIASYYPFCGKKYPPPPLYNHPLIVA